MYTIALGLDNLCIDLPPELGSDVNRYNATLGHKANHSFQPNAEIHPFLIHPILGKTNILLAGKDISAGSEVTINYGYDANPQQPDWYIQQWDKFLEKN